MFKLNMFNMFKAFTLFSVITDIFVKVLLINFILCRNGNVPLIKQKCPCYMHRTLALVVALVSYTVPDLYTFVELSFQNIHRNDINNIAT